MCKPQHPRVHTNSILTQTRVHIRYRCFCYLLSILQPIQRRDHLYQLPPSISDLVKAVAPARTKEQEVMDIVIEAQRMPHHHFQQTEHYPEVAEMGVVYMWPAMSIADSRISLKVSRDIWHKNRSFTSCQCLYLSCRRMASALRFLFPQRR